MRVLNKQNRAYRIGRVAAALWPLVLAGGCSMSMPSPPELPDVEQIDLWPFNDEVDTTTPVTKTSAEDAKRYLKTQNEYVPSATETDGALVRANLSPRERSAVVDSWLRAAESGSPLAEVVVASLYENGTGVARDEYQAAAWYRKAAENGYARGQHHLGRMYHFGVGVAIDNTEAAYWLRQSAENGDAQGQGLLALLYYEGKGVPQNFNRAYMWASVAATGDGEIALARDEELLQPFPDEITNEIRAETLRQNREVQEWAKDIREAAAERMTTEQIAEAQREAASWWERLNGRRL